MKRLDLIIDALEKAQDGWQSFDEYKKALAAARELRELKTTTCAIYDMFGNFVKFTNNQKHILNFQNDGGYRCVKLYALGDEK